MCGLQHRDTASSGGMMCSGFLTVHCNHHTRDDMANIPAQQRKVKQTIQQCSTLYQTAPNIIHTSIFCTINTHFNVIAQIRLGIVCVT